MKQKDHKALACYLLEHVNDGLFWKKAWHRRVFMLGCIGPDYVPFTYLRGFFKSRAMLGHNAPYSQKHIVKSMGRLQRRGVKKLRDCFALGTLMHYLADSFTFPHTEEFSGNMRAHRTYENDLHECFADYLKSAADQPLGFVPILEELPLFLRCRREAYVREEKSTAHDSRQILHVCSGVFQELCCCGRP